MSVGDLLLPLFFHRSLPRLRVGSALSLPFARIPLTDERTLRVEARDEALGLEVGGRLGAGDTIGLLGEARVVAPFGAKVKELRPVPHLYGGLPGLAVRIEKDGDAARKPEKLDGLSDDAEREALLERLDELGVSTFGAAPRPLSQVLGDNAEGRSPATVIVNAADEEPLLSSEDELLRERASDIEAALAVVSRASGAEEVMLAALATAPLLVPPRYPESLDEMVARRAIGEGAREPVVVVSLEEALAAHDAITKGAGPALRYLTVVGADETRANVIAALGTPVAEVLGHVGFDLEAEDRVAFGGPMRGRSQLLEDASVDATTDGIVVFPQGDPPDEVDPCINCGSCIDACPARLQPNVLGRNAEFGFFDQNKTVWECIGCGLCAYVCPSARPLLQWIELTVAELNKAGLEEQEAET